MGASAPQTLTFAIYGPITRADLPGLCARVRALLEASGGAELALCDVHSVPADAVTVDAVARLALAARRHGCQIRMLGAAAGLRDLIAFMGLGDVLRS